MPFNPQEYIKKPDQPMDFDPKAYLAKKDTPKEDSSLKTFGNSAANAASLGYMPDISAAVEPTAFKFLDFVTGSNTPTKSNPNFAERREAYAKDQEALAKENPKAALAGTLVGGALTGAALAPVLPAAGATAGGRVIQAAKTGAILGGAQSPQQTEGQYDPIQLESRLKGSALGAGIGAASQGLVEGVSQGAQTLSNYFGNKSAEKAVRAAGGTKADFKELQAKGTLQEVGNQAIDDGSVTAFATPKTVSARVDAKIKEGSAKLNDLITGVEAKLADKGFVSTLTPEDQKVLVASTFRPQEQASKIKDYIRQKYNQIPDAKLQAAFDEVDSWLGTKAPELGIKDLQDMKVQMNRFLKDSDFWKQPSSFAKEGTLAVRKSLKEGVENSADGLAKVLGDQGGQIRDLNRKIGNNLTLQDIAENRTAMDSANRAFGLTDTLAGVGGFGAGFATGDTIESRIERGLVGASLGGVNKIGRTFGAPVQAVVFRSAAKGLSQLPDVATLAKNNPTEFQGLINRFVAAVSGQDATRPGEVDPIIKDQKLLKIFQEDPKLIDTIQDPARRRILHAQIDRSPSQGGPSVSPSDAVQRRLKTR